MSYTKVQDQRHMRFTTIRYFSCFTKAAQGLRGANHTKCKRIALRTVRALPHKGGYLKRGYILQYCSSWKGSDPLKRLQRASECLGPQVCMPVPCDFTSLQEKMSFTQHNCNSGYVNGFYASMIIACLHVVCALIGSSLDLTKESLVR